MIHVMGLVLSQSLSLSGEGVLATLGVVYGRR